MFEKFISEFCKVQFLCYEGDPNWLGWGVIGIAGLIAGLVAYFVLLELMEDLFSK